MFDLGGRHALVSGGGTGIGKAIATALVTAGASVVICGRRLEKLVATSEELSRYGRARYVQYDVTDLPDTRAIVEQVGAVDILVNNAGFVRRKPWLELSEEDIREAMRIHLEAPLKLSQAFVPGMVDCGFGRIINVISIWGSSVQNPSLYPGVGVEVAPYCVSKHAQFGLTRYLASVLGPSGITVNSISPGPIQVERNRDFFTGDVAEALAAAAPIGRLGLPSDVGTAAVFLAAEGSSYVTGLDLLVDGGSTIW